MSPLRKFARLTLLVSLALTLVPAAVYAQSITGVARDTSGAVLPGVTVDVESPALIEQIRSAVTDGTGRFRIEGLRPGTYSVTFRLAGFATVLREGIELTGTFVATVNADLRVGTLEETVTVTGEASVVDVQSVTRQRVLDQEIVDTLPLGRTPMAMVTIIPGVTQTRVDVGGVVGNGGTRSSMVVRGVRETNLLIGNLTLKSPGGSSSAGGTITNIGAFQEMVVDTQGVGVEMSTSGALINMIPRDGGNTFSGRFFANFANSSMQGNNITQDLKDRGLGTQGVRLSRTATGANSLDKMWDVNPGLGGPIRQDRLWFYWSARYAGTFQNSQMFFNRNAGDPTKWTYEADRSRQVAAKNKEKNWSTVRLTLQASQRNKIGFLWDESNIDDLPRPQGARTDLSPESAMGSFVTHDPLRHGVGDWTSPVTNRFLLQANSAYYDAFTNRPQQNVVFPPHPSGVKLIQVQEQSTNLTYRADAATRQQGNTVFGANLIGSYITGAHAAKVGVSYEWGALVANNYTGSSTSSLAFRFRNGRPNRVELNATPYDNLVNFNSYGLFGQDRWTIDRFTLTAGLRYEFLGTYFPETIIGPGELAPNRNITFPRTDGVSWHDLTGTSALAVDLTGDGKTALKVSVGKYMAALVTRVNLVAGLNPADQLVTRTRRSWNDRNRDFVPDCDLLNPARNGECGAMSDPNFGTTKAARNIDPDLTNGWGKRPEYHWQFSAGVQRELLPGVSVDVDFWRTVFGNFVVEDNRAVGPADYDAFSITAPVDSRLPGGGGQVISGLADIKPSSFGRPSDTLITTAGKFGKQTDHWNGVDITINARPGEGILLQGGTSTQRRSTNNCDVVTKVDNPGALYCDVEGTFLTQVKFVASYTIPRIDVQVSGNFQSLPGPEIAADFRAGNSVVQPSLGRRLAGRARNVTVNLVEPRTLYGERLNMFDLRFGKILRFGGTRATVHLDLNNVLNTSAVVLQNNSFAVWQRPSSILPARFAKVGFALDF